MTNAIGSEAGRDWLSIVGVCLAVSGILAGICTIGAIDSATCPKCGETLSQGPRPYGGDGIFACKKCGGRWRTSATWGFD